MTAPIGSIVAYAGTTEPADVFEPTSGWMLCDGRVLNRTDPEHAALFEAIGFSWGGNGDDLFNIPDLLGYFLRGVDTRSGQDVPPTKDPDNFRRTENRPGGNTGPSVGSIQSYATARPPDAGPQSFQIIGSGDHSHPMDFEITATRDVNDQSNTVAFPHQGPPTNAPRTGPGGDHTHTLLGGNRETRPINAYVHWIIRYKDVIAEEEDVSGGMRARGGY